MTNENGITYLFDSCVCSMTCIKIYTCEAVRIITNVVIKCDYVDINQYIQESVPIFAIILSYIGDLHVNCKAMLDHLKFYIQKPEPDLQRKRP